MDISLSSLLIDRSRRDPTRIAILTPDDPITYERLVAEAAAIAALLTEHGLGGLRIAMLLPNIPRFAAVLHGILGAAGSAVMINPMNSRREITEQVLDSGAAAAFTTSALRDHLPSATRTWMVDNLPDGIDEVHRGEERWLPLDRAAPTSSALVGGDHEAAVLFTNAEAGRARGAVLTHRNLIANLRSTIAAMALDENDRVLAALPQVHAFGLTVTVNATLAAGGAIVPMDRFSPARSLELMAGSGTTVLAGVPAMFMGLLSAAERTSVPEHALRITLTGGAPVGEEVQERWERLFGLPLRQGYGLTEASPVCLFNGVDWPNRIGTLGHALPHVEVTIQDERGEVLPDGEVGEICIRGENVFQGYLDDEAAGPAPFRRGWLRTGDLGSRDPDGYMRFRGLLKAMFTRSGFNIYPREIERALAEDPEVWSARVTSRPDPLRENEIVIEVEPTPGTTLTEEEVREICRARLAAYKQPGSIVILEGSHGVAAG